MNNITTTSFTNSILDVVIRDHQLFFVGKSINEEAPDVNNSDFLFYRLDVELDDISFDEYNVFFSKVFKCSHPQVSMTITGACPKWLPNKLCYAKFKINLVQPVEFEKNNRVIKLIKNFNTTWSIVEVID